MNADPTTGAPTGAPEPWREPWLRSLLRCPADRAELADGAGPDGAPALLCTDPAHPVAYPVTGGIPVLLVDEALPVGAGAPGAGGADGGPR